MRKQISKRKKMFLSIISVFVLIISYSVISYNQYNKNPGSRIIPTVVGIEKYSDENGVSHTRIGSQLVRAFYQVLTPNHRSGDRWLLRDLKATIYRLTISLSIAVITAFVLGMAIGCYPVVEAVFDWPLAFLSKITPTGALSVFFVLFGTDTKMFVAMIVFGILPGMIQSICVAVKQVPEELINKALTLGSSTLEIIFSIIGRYVLPNIIESIKACIGPAMIFLIAAETLCADTGFGSTIRQQSRLTNMDIVFVYLGVLAALGFVIDLCLKYAQKFFCPWYVKDENNAK